MKNLLKGLVLVALLGTVFFVNFKPALAGSAPSIIRVDGPTDVKTGVGNSWTIIPATTGDFSYYVNWADGTPEVSGTAPTFLHTYTRAAIYNVVFTIKDAGGSTNYKAVSIWVSGTTQTSPPTITALSPALGAPGSSVTITGTGFSSVGNTVYYSDYSYAYNGIYSIQNISSDNGTSLSFTVPEYINSRRITSEPLSISVSNASGQMSNYLIFTVYTPAVSIGNLNLSLASNYSTIPTSISAGSTNNIVLSMNLATTGADVTVTDIYFRSYGNCSSVTNLNLKDSATDVSLGLVAVLDNDCLAKFNLSQPLVIAKGTYKTLSLFTDIPTSVSIGSQIQFYLTQISADAQGDTTGAASIVSPLLTVNSSSGLALTITTASPLPNAKVGVNYSPTFTATGGAAPYTWGISSTFIPGLIWDSSLCKSLVCSPVTGAPTTAGTYTITVTVNSGSLPWVSKQFTLTVDPAATSSTESLISVALDASTPVSSSVKPGTTAVNFTNFIIKALTNQNIAVNKFTVKGLSILNQSTWGVGETSLKNIKICTRFGLSLECYGSLSILPADSGSNTTATGEIIFTSGIVIPGNSSQTFWIYADVGSSAADSFSLGLSSVGFLYQDASGLYTRSATKSISMMGNSQNISSSSTQPIVTSVSPTSGPLGTEVTIKGQNFGVIQKNESNTVTIYNDKPFGSSDYHFYTQTITSSDATQLKMTVSASNLLPGNYKIEVTKNYNSYPYGMETAVNKPEFVITSSTTGLTITTASPLPNAKVGQFYSTDIAASDAHIDSWSFISGSLPPGIFVGSGSSNCYYCYGIGGTPTTAGTYTFTVAATSDSQTASKQFTLTVDPAMTTNAKPMGWIDSISKDGIITGWAVDPDHLDVPINIHVYFDSPAGSKGSTSVVFGSTDIQRDDVNLIMSATGTHGFRIPILDIFRDGKKHTAYVYAIDVDDSSGASNASLWGSPKVFNLPKTSNVQRHPRGTVVIGEGATVYFLGTEMRYPYPSPEVFFSWGAKFSDLVLANAGDLAMPIGPIVQMKQ